MPIRWIAPAALCALSLLARAETPQESFERAMQERARGELHEAIRGFQSILDEHPGLGRARLELAVAYYHAMDHQAALEQARRVLDDPATPPAVRANVERLISQIEADAAPHRFGGSASLGYLHDSNVTAGPSSPGLSLGANATRRSDNALTFGLGGTHRYLSRMRPGLGGRDGALLWQSQALLNRIAYRNESAFDLQVLTLTTGPAWISPPRLRASAPVQFERLDLGGHAYLDMLGGNPAVVFGGPAGTEAQFDAQLQRRDYRRTVDAGRDSRYRSLGLQAGRVIGGMTLQAGARLNREDADAASWDYHGSEWFALAARRFAPYTTAYLRFTRMRSDYDEADPTAATGRTDKETRFALGAAYQFGDRPDGPWSLAATLLEIRHRSNLPMYAFDRRQWSLTLTGSF